MHIFITFHFSPAPTVYLILLAVATLVGISVCTDHYAWMDYSHDELVMSKSWYQSGRYPFPTHHTKDANNRLTLFSVAVTLMRPIVPATVIADPFPRPVNN